MVTTWCSLGTIFAGGLLYVLTDYRFTLTAYCWGIAYHGNGFCVVMTVGLSTWGLVLYNNLEALMLFPVELLIMGELKKTSL